MIKKIDVAFFPLRTVLHALFSVIFNSHLSFLNTRFVVTSVSFSCRSLFRLFDSPSFALQIYGAQNAQHAMTASAAARGESGLPVGEGLLGQAFASRGKDIKT